MLKLKKHIVFLIALIVSVSILLSCAVIGSYANQQKTTIKFLVNHLDFSSLYQDLDIIAQYKKHRPDVELIVDYQNYPMSNLGDILKQYDVALVPSFENIINENIEVLKDVSDFTAVKNNLFAKEMEINGNVYGIPNSSSLELVWYRKSIFKEYSLSVPKTWDEFVQNAITIQKGKKYTPLALDSQDHWAKIMFTKSLACVENGSGTLWNTMINQRSPFSKGKPLYHALEKFTELMANELLTKPSGISLGAESLNMFRDKKAAMFSWKEYFKRYFIYDDDVGCFFLPARDKATDPLHITSNIDAYMLVSKDCNHINAVKDFVDWHYSKEWYLPYINQRGYTSVVKGLTTSYIPSIQGAFDAAGTNINFVTPSIASMDFYRKLNNARILFEEIANDIIAGRELNDLTSNLNRQWNMASITGAPIALHPKNSGQYTETVQAGQEYIPPSSGTAYSGADVESEKDVHSSVENSIMISSDHPYAYVYSVKTRIDASKNQLKPMARNDSILVPAHFFEEAFGASVDASNRSAIKISYLENKAVLSLNRSEMEMDGKIIKLKAPPQILNGVLYIPINGIADVVLNKKVICQKKITVICNEDSKPLKGEEKAYIDRATQIFKNEGLLRITIDPRIELYKIMEILSGTGGNRVTGYDSIYRKEVVSYFTPYLYHPSVKAFKDAKSQLGNAAFPVMLNYSAPPSLTLQAPFNAEEEYNKINIEAMNALIEAMRLFSKDTDFINFYSKNYKIYRLITQKAEKEANEGRYLEQLIDYYGTSLKSYSTILAPLLAMVSGGPHVDWEEGVIDTYNLVSSLYPENGIPAFGNQERLRGMIWHEFGHSYINPLVDSQWDELEGFSALVERSDMPSIYGGKWDICVYEHLVRAITARLIYHASGEEAGAIEVQNQKKEGFVFIEDVCEKLVEYEEHREQYPTFADYYPNIIEMFEEKYEEMKQEEIAISMTDYLKGRSYCDLKQKYTNNYSVLNLKIAS